MNKPSPVKRGLTLTWSIGLGIIVLGITTVMLLPATKSARIRFDEPSAGAAEGESGQAPGEERGADDSAIETELSP